MSRSGVWSTVGQGQQGIIEACPRTAAICFLDGPGLTYEPDQVLEGRAERLEKSGLELSDEVMVQRLLRIFGHCLKTMFKEMTRMVLYNIHGSSFKKHSTEVISQILSCPTIARIIFPAILSQLDGQTFRIADPQAFDISQIVAEWSNEPFAHLTLNGDTGVQFRTLIYWEASVTPNVFNLRFSDDHLRQGTISFPVLKQLIEEVVPVFKCDRLSIYPLVSGPQVQYFEGPGETYFPIKLGWMTYFGEELVSFLTPKRFENLESFEVKLVDLTGGILVTLSDRPFDPDNPEHWLREAAAISELGLDQLKRKR